MAGAAGSAGGSNFQWPPQLPLELGAAILLLLLDLGVVWYRNPIYCKIGLVVHGGRVMGGSVQLKMNYKAERNSCSRMPGHE